jgi:flagellin
MRLLNGEADRVTESRTGFLGGTGPLTRSIVTPLYLSNNINPGRLEYNIAAVGQHAVLGGVVANPPELVPPLASELLYDNGFRQGDIININGINVRVEADDTWSSFHLRVMQTFEYAGINIDRDAGLLYSNIAGSDQRIRITGNADLLAGMGLTAGESFGTDAVVGNIQLFDSLGNLVTGDLAVSTRGNQVLIRGTRGEDIRFNIQVDFDSDNNQHVFGNGDVVAPQDMTMVFRDFGPLRLQIGPNHNMAMPVQIPRLNAETLGFVEYVAGRRRNILNYANTEGATLALDITDRALHTVSQVRARLGAYQNRLESTVRSLDVAAEQTESSRSLIQDADMARESTRFAQFNVMFQSAMAMLGQANQRPQQLISLLQ